MPEIMSNPVAYRSLLQAQLPPGVISRVVRGVNGLDMHVLEAGAAPDRPVALLLHGFPELAFSWRALMLPLAQAGYHVIAPDQRGYGATTGFDPRFQGDLEQFRMRNLVVDQLALLARLNIGKVRLLVGHDFGSPVAAWGALIRPDVFESAVLMSGPNPGPPKLPFEPAATDLHAELACLDRPRKHYQWYYSGASAERDMLNCRQGFHAFMRAYYHYKSADWDGNRPFLLADASAQELAKLPTYYVMDLHADMAQTVAPFMPDAEKIAANRWLTDAQLSVYVAAFAETGLQAALNWYRCMTNGMNTADFALFSGRKIEVPTMFIAGKHDWGMYKKAGEYEKMVSELSTRWFGARHIDGAGHWVQQEQPEAVARALLAFAEQFAR